jgi:hypothetical protein
MTNVNPLDSILKVVRIVRNKGREEMTLNTHDQVRLLISSWPLALKFD